MSYIAQKLRKFGWRRLGVVACRLIWERIYRQDRYFLFQRSSEPLPLPRQSALQAIPITMETMQTFSRAFPFRPDRFRNRLARGLRGFFYLREDQTPVAYHWYVVGADYYEPVYHWTFHLGEREGYIFDGYVLPERRGSIVTAQGLAYTLSRARECGAETIFSVTDKNNATSWKLHLHLGFEIVGCLEVTRLLTRAVHARQVDFRQHVSPEMLAAMTHYAQKKARSAPGADALDKATVTLAHG